MVSLVSFMILIMKSETRSSTALISRKAARHMAIITTILLLPRHWNILNFRFVWDRKEIIIIGLEVFWNFLGGNSQFLSTFLMHPIKLKYRAVTLQGIKLIAVGFGYCDYHGNRQTGNMAKLVTRPYFYSGKSGIFLGKIIPISDIFHRVVVTISQAAIWNLRMMLGKTQNAESDEKRFRRREEGSRGVTILALALAPELDFNCFWDLWRFWFQIRIEEKWDS